MDDLLLVEPMAELFQDLKNKLANWFKMTDMGPAELYLSIEISQQPVIRKFSNIAHWIRLIEMNLMVVILSQTNKY